LKLQGFHNSVVDIVKNNQGGDLWPGIQNSAEAGNSVLAESGFCADFLLNFDKMDPNFGGNWLIWQIHPPPNFIEFQKIR
jgi:hypothetical protein